MDEKLIGYVTEQINAVANNILSDIRNIYKMVDKQTLETNDFVIDLQEQEIEREYNASLEAWL